jgi:hypothetical protein
MDQAGQLLAIGFIVKVEQILDAGLLDPVIKAVDRVHAVGKVCSRQIVAEPEMTGAGELLGKKGDLVRFACAERIGSDLRIHPVPAGAPTNDGRPDDQDDQNDQDKSPEVGHHQVRLAPLGVLDRLAQLEGARGQGRWDHIDPETHRRQGLNHQFQGQHEGNSRHSQGLSRSVKAYQQAQAEQAEGRNEQKLENRLRNDPRTPGKCP